MLALYRADGAASIIKMIQKQDIGLFCEILKKYPSEIKYVTHTTSYVQLCMVALKRDGLVLRFIQPRTDLMYYVAINNNGMAIKYILPTEQTETLGLIALKQNVKSIKYICNRTSEMWTWALKKNGAMIKYFDRDDFTKYNLDSVTMQNIFLTLLQIAIEQNKVALVLAKENAAFDFVYGGENTPSSNTNPLLLICNKKDKTKHIVPYDDNLFDAILNDMIKLCSMDEITRAIDQHKITDNYDDYVNDGKLHGYYFCRDQSKTKYVIIFKPSTNNISQLSWSTASTRINKLNTSQLTTRTIMSYQIIL
jgi:hypothetical protein